MANIQNPNGFEANETIDGVNDIMHIFQPGSSGVRRNKRIILNTLKAFFQTVIAAVSGNIVTFSGSAAIQDSGVAVADVGLNSTHRGLVAGNPHVVTKSEVSLSAVPNTDFTTPVGSNTTHRTTNNGSDHSFIDQDVKSTAGPTFIDGKRLVTSANYLHQSANITENEIYDKLSSFLPNIGDEIKVSGCTLTYIITRLKRTGASELTMYSFNVASGGILDFTIVDGDSSVFSGISIIW